MKTDLGKILSVSGQHGLYMYIAQARTGAVAQGLGDGKRTVIDARSRITSLADIAIYTDEGEMKLAEVFTALAQVLDSKEAPGPKADDQTIRELFVKAVPTYDENRFYLSHMRKIVDWYNQLLKYASLDFESGEEN